MERRNVTLELSPTTTPIFPADGPLSEEESWRDMVYKEILELFRKEITEMMRKHLI